MKKGWKRSSRSEMAREPRKTNCIIRERAVKSGRAPEVIDHVMRLRTNLSGFLTGRETSLPHSEIHK
ncbi:MAG: hypothetical protein H6Q30_2630 [Bacteroidetes bacterium]|nr:hypothetical protein [Bacteroidota bacterium]